MIETLLLKHRAIPELQCKYNHQFNQLIEATPPGIAGVSRRSSPRHEIAGKNIPQLIILPSKNLYIMKGRTAYWPLKISLAVLQRHRRRNADLPTVGMFSTHSPLIRERYAKERLVCATMMGLG